MILGQVTAHKRLKVVEWMQVRCALNQGSLSVLYEEVISDIDILSSINDLVVNHSSDKFIKYLMQKYLNVLNITRLFF